jgi:hypothetical protein
MKIPGCRVYLGFEADLYGALHADWPSAPHLALSVSVDQPGCYAQCCDAAGLTPSASAILTRSATDLASIFFII